ncbi:transcriptional attenuator, LytR family [Fervidobacterium changbaicum]|uniref:LCP family protein n=2 Tax=Fervidobacterium TaxID=2422 RepID=A0AAI8GE10_FERIS|nr:MULTISPECIES: LCP family protein [Fervidobacterium]AMW33586.1 LCP family protein [Fervidobacterium islandicum]QAV33645.1 LytR family transcriptional regulator [Fervidobacterium changbaicum]SDH76761.1 transcriptional attenuator, LytR family [Fervidobacterium changbaicum]
MKNVLYVFVIFIGIAAALFVSTIWIEMFLRIFFIPTEDPVNILVLGLDKDIGGTRRTDVILVASIDLEKKKMLLSSIPRDLMIDGKKINAYYQSEGLEKFKKRIEQLTGMSINRYFIVDYDIFKFLGDELGPIEIFVDRPMHYKDVAQNLEIDFSPGYYKMKGKELLAYLRFRKTAEGDIGRLDKQRVIIEKLAQKALQKNVFALTELYKEVKKRTEFNIEIGEVVYILSKVKNGFQIESVPFPFYIGEDGNLYIDESKIEQYRASFTTGEKKLEEKYRFYVINNTKDRTIKFGGKIENLFSSKGYKPNNIFYEGVDVNIEKNTVLILRKNEGLKKYIDKLIEDVFPQTKFEVVYVEDRIDYVSKYLSIIGELTKSGKKVVFPIDFIIVLKSDLQI